MKISNFLNLKLQSKTEALIQNYKLSQREEKTLVDPLQSSNQFLIYTDFCFINSPKRLLNCDAHRAIQSIYGITLAMMLYSKTNEKYNGKIVFDDFRRH